MGPGREYQTGAERWDWSGDTKLGHVGRTGVGILNWYGTGAERWDWSGDIKLVRGGRTGVGILNWCGTGRHTRYSVYENRTSGAKGVSGWRSPLLVTEGTESYHRGHVDCVSTRQRSHLFGRPPGSSLRIHERPRAFVSLP